MARGSRDIEAQLQLLGLDLTVDLSSKQLGPARPKVVELFPEQDLAQALQTSLQPPAPPAPASPIAAPASPWLAPDGRTWPNVLGRGLSAVEVDRLHKTGSPLDPTKKFPRPSKTAGWWEVAPGEFSANIGAWVKG